MLLKEKIDYENNVKDSIAWLFLDDGKLQNQQKNLLSKKVVKKVVKKKTKK